MNRSQFPQGGQQQIPSRKTQKPPQHRGDEVYQICLSFPRGDSSNLSITSTAIHPTSEEGVFCPFGLSFPRGDSETECDTVQCHLKKGYIGTMDNTTTPIKGTRGTFTHPDLPRMGKMTGTIGEDKVFLPDEKYHHKLFDLYGVEALEGLLLDGGGFVPVEE